MWQLWLSAVGAMDMDVSLYHPWAQSKTVLTEEKQKRVLKQILELRELRAYKKVKYIYTK